MEFEQYAQLVNKQFDKMCKHELYVVNIDKNVLWKHYLDSFPDGTNEVYKTNRHYDCNCCRQFVTTIGKVVALVNGKMVSVWDIPNASSEFKVVTEAMSNLINKQKIVSVFRSKESKISSEKTVQELENGGHINWNHFFCVIPRNYVTPKVAESVGELNTSVQLFRRGLDELKLDSLTVILDLIKENSIYRGAEFKNLVMSFLTHKKTYDNLKKEKEKNIYVWEHGLKQTNVSRFRNTVIGTLAVDLSKNVDLNEAVAMYESKVAPTNYKRTTKLVTQGMIEQALKTISSLGIEDSLHRRYAVPSDLSINDVIFADRETTAQMKNSLKALLLQSVSQNNRQFDNVSEIKIEDFIKEVVPKITSLEVLFESKHKSNLVSLVAPKYLNSKKIIMWDNNFSWSYIGEITDSIKERVKIAGGKVNADLRVSLSWTNKDDLDLSVTEPSGVSIYYGNKISSNTGGNLDIDMNVHNPVRNAVENITWPDRRKIPNGNIQVIVNNFNKRETCDVGFEIEIEVDGKIYNLTHDLDLSHKKQIVVCEIEKTKDSINIVKIHKDVKFQAKSTEIWGLQTEVFQKVNLVCYSPNYWGENNVGNKHYMFMLNKCINPEQTRGLYTEFLSSDLSEHRRVFELLGSKLKCENSNEQLSGLGFSSTIPNSFICRVKGTFNRDLRVII